MPNRDWSCFLVHPLVWVNSCRTDLMRFNLSRGRLACMEQVFRLTPRKVMECAGPSTLCSAMLFSARLCTEMRREARLLSLPSRMSFLMLAGRKCAGQIVGLVPVVPAGRGVRTCTVARSGMVVAGRASKSATLAWTSMTVVDKMTPWCEVGIWQRKLFGGKPVGYWAQLWLTGGGGEE